MKTFTTAALAAAASLMLLVPAVGTANAAPIGATQTVSGSNSVTLVGHRHGHKKWWKKRHRHHHHHHHRSRKHRH